MKYFENMINDLKNFENNKEKIFKIVASLSKIAFPNMLFFLCLLCMQTISLSFISKKFPGYKTIDAIGITHLYINCTTLIVTVGILTGIENLAGNAKAAKNYYLMGLYIHRGRLIAYTYVVLISIFNLIFGDKILSFFTDDNEILVLASKYMKYIMFMMFIEVIFNLNIRYLALVDKAYVNSIILMITVILHPFFCHFFINFLDLGVKGAGLAIILSQSINSICSSLYLHFYNPIPESYFFINEDCFKGWKEYLDVAIPASTMIFGEWIGFELQSVIAIKISELDYSVHLILVSLDLLLFSFIMGFNIAASVYTSQIIITETKQEVEFSVRIGILYSNIILSIILFFAFIFRLYFIRLIANTDYILEKALVTFPFVILYKIFSTNVFYMNGTFRGLKYNKVPAILSIVNFYIVESSLSIILGFYFKLGVKGIWMSLWIANNLIVLVYMYIYYNLDIEALQIKIKEDMENDKRLINNNNNDKSLNERQNIQMNDFLLNKGNNHNI